MSKTTKERRKSLENLLKPGQKVKDSGQYEIVGARGGKLEGREVTLVKDEPAPPTPGPNERFKLVDKTKHKNK
jgi:hypothetical protein